MISSKESGHGALLNHARGGIPYVTNANGTEGREAHERMKPSSMQISNPYSILGITLIAVGGAFAFVGWYVLDYGPVIALGLSGIIIGSVAVMLGRSLPPLSSEASLSLLEASLDNIAALVEELALRGRAVYLPSSLSRGRLRALIPYKKEDGIELALQRPLDQRLIVRFGREADAFGILVATPGSFVLERRTVPSDASFDDLESILVTTLVSRLALVSSVRVLGDEGAITVEVGRSTLSWNGHVTNEILGSPVASIVATVVAEVLGRPLRIESEHNERGRHTVEFRTIGAE